MIRRRARDWVGRTLLRTGRHQLVNHYALLVMRPDAQEHADVYLGLWRDRWARQLEPAATVEAGIVPEGTVEAGIVPEGITADVGAMKLLHGHSLDTGGTYL